MADLFVLGFDGKERAEAVFNLASELQKQELLDLEDAAMAWRTPDGKVKIQQALSTTATGATGGALWGTLIGALFLAPFAGAAIGAASGALSGKLTDIGIDDATIKRIGATLEPGKAAIFALVRRSTPDKVREAIAPYGPTIIQTSLSKDREEELVHALQS
jgi:uncharacterized membrane protein